MQTLYAKSLPCPGEAEQYQLALHSHCHSGLVTSHHLGSPGFEWHCLLPALALLLFSLLECVTKNMGLTNTQEDAKSISDSHVSMERQRQGQENEK